MEAALAHLIMHYADRYHNRQLMEQLAKLKRAWANQFRKQDMSSSSELQSLFGQNNAHDWLMIWSALLSDAFRLANLRLGVCANAGVCPCTV
jgi:hypothetical protein